MKVEFTNTTDNRAEDLKKDSMNISRSILLIFAVIITVISFKLSANPPGGFWETDKEGPDGHRAGATIMKDREPTRFIYFKASCWLCFYSSLLLVFILVTGTSTNSKVFKSIFVFCLGSLVFLYEVSQTGGDDLIWAFGTVAVALLGGLVYILK